MSVCVCRGGETEGGGTAKSDELIREKLNSNSSKFTKGFQIGGKKVLEVFPFCIRSYKLSITKKNRKSKT